MHALLDALAGAVADGDLGTHFPEDDPDAIDARSLVFVEQFSEYLAEWGWVVGNVDGFLTLGTVRLRPHIEAMRENLAKALRIDLASVSVSVKARSNDGIGPEGEGTACGAWVGVLVYRRDD